MKKLIFALLMIVLISTNMYAVDVVRYFNSASSGGDGTTNATSGANAAYVSFSALESAEDKNLVTRGVNLYAYGTGTFTTIPNISNTWTTDSTHQLIVQNAPGETCLFSGNGSGQILVYPLYCKLIGLSINGISVRCLSSGQAIDMARNKMWGSTGIPAVYLDGANSKFNVYDNFIGSSTKYGVSVAVESSTFTIYNNTIVGCSRGVNATIGYVYLKNNICWGNAIDYNVSGLEGSDNNISGDTSSPNKSYRNLTPVFISSSTIDYHLSPEDTAAIDAGVDLSSDAMFAFSTDYDGEDMGDSFPIGADKYIASGETPSDAFSQILLHE